MTEVITVEEVPGFGPALAAVRQAGGVLLDREAAWQLTIIALATASPFTKAEVLADISDDLVSAAGQLPVGDESGALLQAARWLDHASFQIREALNGRGAEGQVVD